jgi:hypothetical protein
MCFNCEAQQLSVLFGAHSNANSKVFSSIVLPAFGYNAVFNLQQTFSAAAGETTYDEINNRYFVKSGSDILVIDALSGSVNDVIPNAGSFYNMEYDRHAHCLVGMTPSSSGLIMRQLDPATKLYKTKGTLSIMGFVPGESTFDPVNRRYFTESNIGLMAIDSNGILIAVLCSSPFLNGIEYDITTNRIYYLEWKGVNFDLSSLDATSCSAGYVCSLTSDSTVLSGESTFDRTLGIYYSQTNLGIVEINIQTGTVQHHARPNNFAQMEFARITTVNLTDQMRMAEPYIFPNPSMGTIKFADLVSGSSLEIFNSKGQMVLKLDDTRSEEMIDLQEQPQGVYYYILSHAQGAPRYGKLILN